MVDNEVPLVIAKFREFILDPDTNAAIAAIRALTEVLVQSEASTMMEFKEDLQAATQQLITDSSKGNIIAVGSGCELYTRFVTRAFLDIHNFEECKRVLITRGERFQSMAVKARENVAKHAERFITDGCTIMVHGYSRVVATLLTKLASSNKRIKVIVTESRPDNAGLKMLQKLDELGLPGILITDSAVAHYIVKEVDMIFVGAEAVAENGGIINKIGTYQISIIAHAFNKPFYVLAESFKFSRIYPLNQQDLPPTYEADANLHFELPSSTEFWNAMSDFTPPKYIRLLCTDLGILTPSAVSDELIKLYN